eukprot:1359_1
MSPSPLLLILISSLVINIDAFVSAPRPRLVTDAMIHTHASPPLQTPRKPSTVDTGSTVTVHSDNLDIEAETVKQHGVLQMRGGFGKTIKFSPNTLSGLRQSIANQFEERRTSALASVIALPIDIVNDGTNNNDNQVSDATVNTISQANDGTDDIEVSNSNTNERSKPSRQKKGKTKGKTKGKQKGNKFDKFKTKFGKWA